MANETTNLNPNPETTMSTILLATESSIRAARSRKPAPVVNSIEVAGAIARGLVLVNGSYRPAPKPAVFILANGLNSSVQFAVKGDRVTVTTKGRLWSTVIMTLAAGRIAYRRLLASGYYRW
jgi:hypothetical protein